MGWKQVLALLLTIAAAGLALITVFVLSARLWWAFDLFTHFRLQYVVAALVLCLAALAVRAFPAATALAVVALVHGWAIKDLWLGDTPSTPSGLPLRIASANVLESNPTPEQVIDFVRTADADLVVLVEARTARWREILSEIDAIYPHVAPEGWHDGAPVILFSRHPILRNRSANPVTGSRPYLTADIAVDDRTVTVVGVHPSSPSPEDPDDTHRRNIQFDHLAETLEDKDRSVIMAGDFNTSPWSPHFRDLLAATGLSKAADGHGWLPTWPHWFPPAMIPIDHILVRGSVAVAAFRRGPFIGSDHYPVIADLRLP